MKKYFIVILSCSLLFANFAKAQTKEGKLISVIVGSGLTFPDEDIDVSGNGFYVQGEYLVSMNKCFSFRPYAGVIFTSTDNNDAKSNLLGYEVTTNAFLFGGKIRFLVPIPYVAPYFELGLGASIGSFRTYTSKTDITKSGFVKHIPFSIGLALGRMRNFNLAFTYYDHSSVKQISGAIAFGYTFPIDK